ncbi:MAG: sialate O-acetylesterase, partial [Bacteroidota bacterium]
MKKACILFFILLSIVNGYAQIRLPRIIRDSMILQRNQSVKIWGWASPHEKVKAQFNGKSYNTRADGDGNWLVLLPPMGAGGPYTISLSASNRITLSNILFGDVWFCSGQSNMVHSLNTHELTYARDIAEANNPLIRQFLVPGTADLQGPQKDLRDGSWTPAVGEKVRSFSAVAYFFAKKLFEKYRVPIGIINASVGGTPIEAWTSG